MPGQGSAIAVRGPRKSVTDPGPRVAELADIGLKAMTATLESS